MKKVFFYLSLLTFVLIAGSTSVHAQSQGQKWLNEARKGNTNAMSTRNNGNMAGQQTNYTAVDMFNTAVQYYKAKNYVEAVKWYRKAAEQGLAEAQYNLGVCYANGQGITQSYTEAVKWYRKAAEQGLAGAQFNLGLHYYKGEGITQSYTEALKWLRKAKEQGHEDATKLVVEMSQALEN